jgi:hypothetical protein
MFWGAGPALGLLTLLGYFVCMVGAVFIWRHRDDFFVWIEDEVSAFRRNLSRYVVIGPFYAPREQSRLGVISSQFLHSPSHIARSHIKLGTILFFFGLLLFLLDFFI